MNRIVRRRYPVEDLPEDLRKEFATFKTVSVESEGEPNAPEQDMTGWLAAIAARRDALPIPREDPVARVRRLRDEWDD